MKLLLIEATAPAPLKAQWKGLGWQVEKIALKDFPKYSTAPYDAVLFHCPSQAIPMGFKAWRATHSEALLILIMPPTLFQGPSPIDLFQDPVVDDIWPQKSWGDDFWFLLTRLLAKRFQGKQLKVYQKLIADIDSNSEALFQKSDSLVALYEDNLKLATTLQRSLLPQSIPQVPGLTLQTKFIPAAGPGGDYFDIFEIQETRKVGFLLADSQTHGLAAALLGALLKIRIEELRDRFSGPADLVSHLNAEIGQIASREGRRLHLFYGILDRTTLEFEYCLAGKLVPKFYRGAKEFAQVSASEPIGAVATDHAFTNESLQLMPSDLFFLFSGGLEPMATPKNWKSFTELLAQEPDRPDLLAIQNELLSWVDPHQAQHALVEDVTWILGLVNPHTLYLSRRSVGK